MENQRNGNARYAGAGSNQQADITDIVIGAEGATYGKILLNLSQAEELRQWAQKRVFNES